MGSVLDVVVVSVSLLSLALDSVPGLAFLRLLRAFRFSREGGLGGWKGGGWVPRFVGRLLPGAAGGGARS